MQRIERHGQQGRGSSGSMFSTGPVGTGSAASGMAASGRSSAGGIGSGVMSGVVSGNGQPPRAASQTPAAGRQLAVLPAGGRPPSVREPERFGPAFTVALLRRCGPAERGGAGFPEVHNPDAVLDA